MTSTRSRTRQPTPWLVLSLSAVGLVGIVVCLCFVVTGVGGIVYWRSRSTFASEPAVAYVLDASLRMEMAAEGSDGQTRLSVAQAVLAEVIRPAEPSLTSGLRVFGSGASAETCQDTDLLVTYGPANQSRIVAELSALTIGPSSEAALAQAMAAAIRELAQYRGPHYLVVVTGGVDSCNPDAGPLIAQEAERAGVDVQTFVVGYQLDNIETEAIKQFIAEIGRAEYLIAPDSDFLRAILEAIQNYINAPSDAAYQAIALAGALDAQAPTGPDTQPPSGPDAQPPDEPPLYVSQSACDHPYFPLRQGASWQYSYSDSFTTYVAESVVESVSGDLNAAAATISETREGAPGLTYTWDCTPEGITYFRLWDIAHMLAPLATFYATTNSSADFAAITYAASNSTGAMLPLTTALEPGDSWRNSFTIQHAGRPTGDPAASITVGADLSQTHTVGDKQTLETALNTFTVIPVVVAAGRTDTFVSFLPINGRELSVVESTSLTSTVYYAQGVGIVRIEIASEAGNAIVELLEYNIP